jgi:hypothetical protein
MAQYFNFENDKENICNVNFCEMPCRFVKR